MLRTTATVVLSTEVRRVGTDRPGLAVLLGMIDDIAAAQDGVIKNGQAFEEGLSRRAVDRLVGNGKWEKSAPGVLFVCDRPFTDDARIRVAVWGSGPGATLTGLGAAYWLGLEPKAPATIEITVPRGGRSRPLPGTTVRRRDLDSRDVVERRGIRVTNIALTVLESSVHPSGGVRIMDRALQRSTTVDALRAVHRRNPGRHVSRAAERLLRAAESGARSEGERIVVRLLKDNSITGWIANYRYGRYFIDVAFPAERLAIEFDGWAFHSDQARFQNDRDRQNDLSGDWRFLRFTWADLIDHPDRVVARIQQMLASLRPM